MHRRVGGLFDRERAVVEAAVDEFVICVRDGRAQPEQIVPLLRSLLRDSELQLLLRLPGGRELDYVDVDGCEVQPHSGQQIALVSNAVELGVIVLGTSSARRERQARAAVTKARLPIEVVRLRIELRRGSPRPNRAAPASSRHDAERRRLERDLHDGAQQQILAVGMRLVRSRTGSQRMNRRPRSSGHRRQHAGGDRRRAAATGARDPTQSAPKTALLQPCAHSSWPARSR